MNDLQTMEVELTTYKGFAWKAGLAVTHVGSPLRIVKVEEDEFLEEPYAVLYCFHVLEGFPVKFIANNETFLNLQDEVTAAYCQMAISSGLWYKGSP